MSELRLHTEACGELLLLPHIPCLLIRWHGFANSENLRRLLDKGLALYQAHAPHYPCLGWVADTRRFGAMLPVDQQWLLSSWNPRAYAAGIRHLLFLASENIFGQIALQQYMHATNTDATGLRAMYAPSLEGAGQQVQAARWQLADRV
ncbi:hypothetical protein [Hymenobacter rigui]|uniref:Uncharacterized protein n=1 Tax=Hymenobacter rigui TaxID=334424 RepID=A0A428KWC9_9BACT|nr:hypothetical protein [Hymenobacter rigui]RSK51018.1 hypothetical protein EI291_01485 [Hymenobacter rigui]